MNRKLLIHLGIMFCAVAIGSDLAGMIELGNLVYGFAGVLLMLMVSLTLTIAAEKKGQANG